MTDGEYAGDLSPEDTWELLQRDKSAVLIDVRTDAEFAYDGRMCAPMPSAVPTRKR